MWRVSIDAVVVSHRDDLSVAWGTCNGLCPRLRTGPGGYGANRQRVGVKVSPSVGKPNALVGLTS